MVIEWLKIPVPPDRQAHYLQHDRVIWTEMLSKQSGFVGKEVWRDPSDPVILHLVIRWDSLEQWKAVPKPLLRATETAFRAAVGAGFPVQACVTYDVLGAPGTVLPDAATAKGEGPPIAVGSHGKKTPDKI